MSVKTSRQVALDLGIEDPEDQLSTPGHDALLLWCKRHATGLLVAALAADRPGKLKDHVRGDPDAWSCDRFEIEVPVYSRSGYRSTGRREGFLDCVLHMSGRQHGYTRRTQIVATRSGRYKVNAAYGSALDFTRPSDLGFLLAERHSYEWKQLTETVQWSREPTLPGPHPAQFEARFVGGTAVSESGGELVAITREYAEDEQVASVILPVEIKTTIPSLGDLIRQLQRYRGATFDADCYRPISTVAVVSPDDRWRGEIIEQGFPFIAPADVDPEWKP